MSETLHKSPDILSSSKKEIPGLSPERQEILENIAGERSFNAFQNILLHPSQQEITLKEKEKLLYILTHIDIEDLEDIFLLGGFILIDGNGIKDFIDNPDFAKFFKQEKESGKQEKKSGKQEKRTEEQEKESEKLKNFKKTFGEVKEILLKVSKSDQELQTIVNQLEAIYNGNGEDLKQTTHNLSQYLSKDQNAHKLFAQLQDDEDAYHKLYSFLEGTGNQKILQILSSIPREPREFRSATRRSNQILQSTQNPFFTKGENIEKNGNILSQKLENTENLSKIVDTQTLPPRSFISGPNGYKIETQPISKDILNLRSAFTNEKIQISSQQDALQKQISHFEKFPNQEETQKLLAQKEKQLQDISDTHSMEYMILENEIIALEGEMQEIEKVEEKITQLEEKFDALDREYLQKEEDFLKYYNKLASKEHSDINSQDTQAKQTLEFLESIGFTHIPYEDFLKIQAIVNISPASYGFSKPIDLSKGFGFENNSQKNNTQEFINFFNKRLPEDSQIHISSVQSGNIGDQFKKENFKMKLQECGIIGTYGQLNIKNFFQQEI